MTDSVTFGSASLIEPITPPRRLKADDTGPLVTRLHLVRPLRRPSGQPPPLPHDPGVSGVRWLAAAVGAVAMCLVAFGGGVRGLGVTITVVDDAVVRLVTSVDTPGLMAVMHAVAAAASVTVVNLVLLAMLVGLAVRRRLHHLVVLLVAAELSSLLVTIVLRPRLQRPRPFGVPTRTDWGGFALPSVEVLGVTLIAVGVLYAFVPQGRWRSLGKWLAAGVVAVVALARIRLGVDAPTDALLGTLIGVAIPLVGFRVFAPAGVFPLGRRRAAAAHLDIGGARADAIRLALEHQLGLIVSELEPVGWSGSGGSTPLRLTCRGNPDAHLFAKLYARNHLRADRWYKLGRELLYGRLEDERPFNTVRRLVQQEDYALQAMRRAGLPTPESLGFIELTPEREYLLVTEFFENTVELGDAAVDQRLIDSGLGIVRKLWDAGLAHRDIKPANLLVRGGQMLLIDVAFAEIRPTAWRQAVDLANMMLCLALRSSAELVYERALLQFSVAEITEAFGAARGLAVPSQLRHALRQAGRDIHVDFVRLLPRPPEVIGMQRWNFRRVGLWAAVLVLAGVVIAASVPILAAQNQSRTPLGIGDLGCRHFEPLWLEAQSVPTASFVPCLRPLPVGWSVAGVEVDDGRSVITLDHDRAGAAALRVVLGRSCDDGTAIEAGSDQPGVRRYEERSMTDPRVIGRWYETFLGGCVTVDVRSGSDRAEVNAGLPGEAAQIVALTSRVALGEALARRSSGRLSLDPSGPPTSAVEVVAAPIPRR
jgi:tRNA A-37 threonylcarbamoyl transferase component Bud32/membrane-associated phospholipid phosphatase